MLRKMYHISSDKFHNTTHPPAFYEKKKSLKLPLRNKINNNNNKRRVIEKQHQHSYGNWVMFCRKIDETDVKREELIKEIAEFLRKILTKIHHLSRYLLKLIHLL